MIGIDISDRSIKVVELTDDESPRLQTVCWSALPPNLVRRGIIRDPESAARELSAALRKCSPRPVADVRAVLSIPEIQSFVRVLELPAMSEQEMNEAVQWAVRQHIPFDLSRVYLDWQPLLLTGRDAGRRLVLVGAAQREVIDPLLQAVDAVGLRAVAFELEAQAIARSLLPRQATDVRGVLLVDLGATSTNIIFFDAGTMRFTTSIQRGGDDLTQLLARTFKMEPSVADEQKVTGGAGTTPTDAEIAATLRGATLELAKQVYQIVHEHTAQLDAAEGLRAVLLAGGAANLPGTVEVFSSVFPGIPVQLGNPLINVTIESSLATSSLSPQDASHFTTAIGLALRQSEYDQ